MERLLSLDEVCELVQLGPDHVRRAVKRGDLVASKIGGRLRFRADDVERYVDSLRVMPEPLLPRTRKPFQGAPSPVPPRTPPRRLSFAERAALANQDKAA